MDDTICIIVVLVHCTLSSEHLPHPLQIARQILEAHSTMLNLAATDAKLQYIRNWQALQDFGIVYFLVRIGRSKKEVSINKQH